MGIKQVFFRPHPKHLLITHSTAQKKFCLSVILGIPNTSSLLSRINLAFPHNPKTSYLILANSSNIVESSI